MTQTEAVMQNMKSMLDRILDFIVDKNDVIYLDYPLHYNVGDLLIFLGGVDFFKSNDITIKKYYSINNLDISQLHKYITPKTTLLCHGGGNFGDIYKNHQKLRENLVRAFPDNRIIFLPQTVHFQDKKCELESINVFMQHTDLVFFARDLPSFNYFKKISHKTFLMPDMAHFLYKVINFNESKANNTLYFFRNDVEAIPNQQIFGNNSQTLDWEDIVNNLDENVLKKIKRLMKVNRILKISKIDDYVFRLWYEHCWNLVNRSVQTFENYNKIITSRLHGHILTCLLERESILINNSYGKNKAYYEIWTKQISEFVE